uniref:Uncharacterized protein n=1 Tax=viral metagenome TaxID=1070528 RepID=A0A6H1ZMH0_9ZZZZ
MNKDIKEAVEIIDELVDIACRITLPTEQERAVVEHAIRFMREQRKFTVNIGSFIIIEHQVDESSPMAMMDGETGYIKLFDTESQAEEFADANCAWGFNICRLT